MIFIAPRASARPPPPQPAISTGRSRKFALWATLLTLLAATVPAEASDPTVAPELKLVVCPTAGLDDGQSPFATLAAALEVAQSGTTVLVFADPDPAAQLLSKDGVTVEYLGLGMWLDPASDESCGFAGKGRLPLPEFGQSVHQSPPIATTSSKGPTDLDEAPAHAPTGASSQITEGDLVLVDGTVVTEDFTYFNRSGFVHVQGAVTLAAGTHGVILVSRIHLEAGAVLTVEGNLVVDGCVFTHSGPYDLVIAEDAHFTLVRSLLADGNLTVRSGSVAIHDNRMDGTHVTIESTATGAAIFHNLAQGSGWLNDQGVETVRVVDGWGNVGSEAETLNNLVLGLDGSALPAGRTQDANGNIFVQPGDPLFATVNLSALSATISGIEILLGYNTGLLGAVSIGLAADWDVVISTHEGNTGAIGKLDAALGLSFDFADPAGTNADQVFADVELVALGTEGLTSFFHRVKLPDDAFGGEARLTTGGPEPTYLKPFTANSPLITIDGTPPLIDAAGATVEQGGVDMTIEGRLTVQGVLNIAIAAVDELAGIEYAQAVVTLVDPVTSVIVATAVQTGTEPVLVGGTVYTRFDFEIAVNAETPNGIHQVTFTVTDRSGNVASEVLGAIEVNKNEVAVTVQLEGLVPGPVTRDVVFVLTSADGSVLETRTTSLTFVGGLGTLTLAGVPAGAERLSAKAAWNLRRRLDLDLGPDGQAAASFTNAARLLGGDLTGGNTIGTIDFAILRNYFNRNDPEALVADITGSGTVGTIDYAILRTNFNLAGDPP